jgi:hypothetical protein
MGRNFLVDQFAQTRRLAPVRLRKRCVARFAVTRRGWAGPLVQGVERPKRARGAPSAGGARVVWCCGTTGGEPRMDKTRVGLHREAHGGLVHTPNMEDAATTL